MTKRRKLIKTRNIMSFRLGDYRFRKIRRTKSQLKGSYIYYIKNMKKKNVQLEEVTIWAKNLKDLKTKLKRKYNIKN